jgi:hypothetical protein
MVYDGVPVVEAEWAGRSPLVEKFEPDTDKRGMAYWSSALRLSGTTPRGCPLFASPFPLDERDSEGPSCR